MTGYMGSKAASGAYQAIIAAMPPHLGYVETHYGSGVVMREKPRCRWSVAIDVDETVFARFPAPEGVQCIVGDAVQWLEKERPGPGVLIYADPPYVHSSRSSKRYRFDYTDDDHVKLLDVLSNTSANVILSGYENELYRKIVPSTWRKKSFRVMTRGGPRTETLWMNFDEGEPHWHTYAGKDRTDRQRIKRKAERWRSNYASCSKSERLAILEQILKV